MEHENFEIFHNLGTGDIPFRLDLWNVEQCTRQVWESLHQGTLHRRLDLSISSLSALFFLGISMKFC